MKTAKETKERNLRKYKTMSKSNFLKRLAKFNIRKPQVVEFLMEAANGHKQLRTVYTLGRSGRSQTLHNYTPEVGVCLTLIGIDYVVENDAPKGGKTGFHIRVLTKIK